MKKRKNKQTEPDLMERTRAAATFLNGSRDKQQNMFAFLQLFHPEIPAHKARALALHLP